MDLDLLQLRFKIQPDVVMHIFYPFLCRFGIVYVYMQIFGHTVLTRICNDERTKTRSIQWDFIFTLQRIVCVDFIRSRQFIVHRN